MTLSAPVESTRFSLVYGGPFHALLRWTTLRRPDGRSVLRQAFALVTLTWGPFLALALADRVVRGRWDPLVRDFGVHARMLLAIALLLYSEAQLHESTGLCVDRFARGGFARDGNAVVHRIVARAERLRDARMAEIVILAIAVLSSEVLFWSQSPLSAFLRPTAMAYDRSAGAFWYGLIVVPMVQFLFGRWLWRWIIWAQLLWRLSRIHLRLDAMHPDRRGGLAFVREPVVGLAPGLAAWSAAVAGTWASQIALQGASIREFAGTFAGMLILGLLLAFGPLLVWAVPLWCAYLEGVTEFTPFAGDYVRRFRQKWLEATAREQVLGTADIQSLADVGNSFSVLHEMRLFPFDRRAIAIVVVSMAIPVLPLVLNEIPLKAIVRILLSSVVG